MGSQTAPLQKNLSIMCGKLTWNNIIPATIKVETNWVENLKSEKRKQNYDWKPKKILSGTSTCNNCTNFEPAYLSPCRNSKILHQCRAERGHLFSNISYLPKIMHLNGRRWKAIKQVNLVLAGRCNTTVSWTLSHLKRPGMKNHAFEQRLLKSNRDAINKLVISFLFFLKILHSNGGLRRGACKGP